LTASSGRVLQSQIQNITGRIHVPVEYQTTIRARKHTHTQVFFHQPTTPAAPLRGAGRIHGNHQHTSFFRFVRQQLPQFTQACIVRRQGKMSVTVHETQPQVFNSNHVILANQTVGNFVKIIPALIGNPLVQPGNLLVRFLPAATAFFAPRGTSL
jgi:hypothetical protein